MEDDDPWSMTVKIVGQTIDADEAVFAAAVLLHPTQPHELRGLPSGRSRLVSLADPAGFLEALSSLKDNNGIYYTLNPVRSDLGDAAAKVGDVTQRWNILIDCDPVKAEPDGMATDQEKGEALKLAAAVMEYLTGEGWPSPVVIDSGNGGHLIYRTDLPSNDHARVLIGRLLRALAARFDGAGAKVDTKVHNASRISKLPGTLVRKGANRAERPWRMARLQWKPDEMAPVTAAQVEAVAGLEKDHPPTIPMDPWQMIVKEGPDRAGAYVRSAIERELARAVLAPDGERNNTLNDAAFSIGQFVGAGLADRTDVEIQLAEAARRCGLGYSETLKTIQSGLEAGIQSPRELPDSAKPRPARPKLDPDERLITLASEIEPRRVRWLWPDRIPIGKLTTFAGWGGMGKSFVTMDLAARISRGDEIPGMGGECFEPGNVLILNTEDDPDDTSVPRLIVAKADLRKIGFATAKVLGQFTLADLDNLDLMVRQMGGVRLLVIDPATAHLGDINDHKNSELRGLLMPLSLWAMHRQIAVVLVTHVNKPQAGKVEAMARVVGSVAWVNAVRAAVMFARDPNDKTRRLFVPFKANNAPERKGLAYRIVPTETLARVEWLEEVDTSADEALSNAAPQTSKDMAAAILRSVVGAEEVHCHEVVDRANKMLGEEHDIDWWGRVLKKAGGDKRRRGFAGRMMWYFPSARKTGDGYDGTGGTDGNGGTDG
jgi:hypothetical protein